VTSDGGRRGSGGCRAAVSGRGGCATAVHEEDQAQTAELRNAPYSTVLPPPNASSSATVLSSSSTRYPEAPRWRKVSASER
jgi:hypothetical protein